MKYGENIWKLFRVDAWWANKSLEDDLVDAIDEYEGQQKNKKTPHKNRFVRVIKSQLSQIIEHFFVLTTLWRHTVYL